MNVRIDCDEAALARAPKTGPLLIVANHPFGVVDGLAIMDLATKLRPDVQIMVHSLLCQAPELKDYLLPVDFALINWAFVPLYVVCRIWPNLGAARLAMWFSVVAMSIPGAVLFFLAPEMISSAFDSGQGIGIIEAVLLWSPIAMIWPGLASIVIDADTAFMFVLMALTGFLPLLGLMAWLAAQLAGRAVGETHSDR